MKNQVSTRPITVKRTMHITLTRDEAYYLRNLQRDYYGEEPHDYDSLPRSSYDAQTLIRYQETGIWEE